jgi:hypothetical protein
MDPLKIILFAAAFLALLFLGRLLSRTSEVHAASLPRPEPKSANTGPFVVAPADMPTAQAPALIGAEIAFPIQLPPVKRREDGTYNRPEILNYYFRKTDLVRGPADPDSLFDELTIETLDPGNNLVLNYGYTVATGAGLRRAMEEDKLASLYLDALPVIIVPSWDLALILETAVEEIMKSYGAQQNDGPGQTS